MNVPEPSVLDVLNRPLEVRARALLRSDLHDPVVAPRRFHRQPALADVVRRRLLHVHVLARVAGIDGHEGVPVLGGADDDGLNVLVLEQLAVVAIHLRLPAGGLEAILHVRLVDVADGDHIHVRLRDESPFVRCSLIPAPDEADADAVAGRRTGGLA